MVLTKDTLDVMKKICKLATVSIQMQTVNMKKPARIVNTSVSDLNVLGSNDVVRDVKVGVRGGEAEGNNDVNYMNFLMIGEMIMIEMIMM